MAIMGLRNIEKLRRSKCAVAWNKRNSRRRLLTYFTFNKLVYYKGYIECLITNFLNHNFHEHLFGACVHTYVAKYFTLQLSVITITPQ